MFNLRGQLTMTILIFAALVWSLCEGVTRPAVEGEIRPVSVSQSSTWSNDEALYGAHRANDGDLNTHSNTARQSNAWFKATLDREYCIRQVLLYQYSRNSLNTYTCSQDECTCEGKYCYQFSLSVYREDGTVSGPGVSGCKAGDTIKFEIRPGYTYVWVHELTIIPRVVDGGWSDFGDWSECSVECGGGEQTRNRECNNPVPDTGGADCEGEESETQACNAHQCPVDGGWSGFGDWSECSAECGGGVITRTRQCNNPTPDAGGADCEGENFEAQACNTQQCSVDGGWSCFGDWTECSANCGGGTQTRTRQCNDPAPEGSGADCEGEESETQECNTRSCAGNDCENAYTRLNGCNGFGSKSTVGDLATCIMYCKENRTPSRRKCPAPEGGCRYAIWTDRGFCHLAGNDCIPINRPNRYMVDIQQGN